MGILGLTKSNEFQLKTYLMRKNHLLLPIIVTTLFLLTGASILRNGGSPGGYTDSPGDGQNCTSCHAGNPSSAEDWITTNIPEEGYVPGESYTINLQGVDEDAAKMGFELTAEYEDGAKTKGIKLANSDRTKLTNSDNAVTHTAEGNTFSNDTNTWQVEWQAPEAASGKVTFYAAVNAANGDGTNNGDQIYTTQHAVSASDAAGIAKEEGVAVKVYPNPVTDVLKVQTSLAIHKFSLYTINGQLIKQGSPEQSSNASTLRIQLENIQTGYYNLVLDTSEGGISRKIMIP